MALARGQALSSQSGDRQLKSSSDTFAPAKGVEAIGTAGICVGLGVVLPLIVHGLGLSPRAFLPMHFPVFLAGILLSPVYAGLVGIMAPALSCGFTGQPTIEQVLRMMPELAVYGAGTSLILRFLPLLPGLPRNWGRMAAMAVAMLVAMVLGRATYIAAAAVFATAENLGYYVAVLITPAIPGIIAQLLLVPVVASRIEKPSAPSVYERTQGVGRR